MTAKPFKIRTVTAFVTFSPHDFDGFREGDGSDTSTVGKKIHQCANLVRQVESRLVKEGYEVQTVRIATNPFGEWLTPVTCQDTDDDVDTLAITALKLKWLNELLPRHNINFCSLGPSTDPKHTTSVCPVIVSVDGGRFSCSANVDACDVDSARAAARCIKTISTLDKNHDSFNLMGDKSHLVGGLGNFRFCAASSVKSGVPFFPAARGTSLSTIPQTVEELPIGFGIGLENGEFARKLLEEAKSIDQISNVFFREWSKELLPIQELCTEYVDEVNSSMADKRGNIYKFENSIEYLGIDTSLNPSLDDKGSVAAAIECLDEVRGSFGQNGSLGAAAAITTSLQSIPDIRTTGYCGLMLPVLEDRRLAEIGMQSSSADTLTIQKLLFISSVCGVGIDTVPIPGDVSEDSLSSLILDVAALAGRWDKPLSCRVFPVPGSKAGEKTEFNSPYMCNSCILDIA